MPFKMSNWLENTLANFIMRGVGFSFSPTVYLGLFTSFTEANDGNSFVEVPTFGTGYSRRAISFVAPVNGVTENASTIIFPMATTNLGSITYFGIFDALVNGNLLYWGLPLQAVTCNSGEQVEFLTGDLDLSIINNPSNQLANDIINMTLRNTPRAVPSAWYTAILTSFTNDTTFVECTDANYVREATVFSVPSNGLVSNSSDLIWPAAAGPYTATHMAVFDAPSGGNMLVRGALPVPKSVVATQQFKFALGDFQIVFD